MTQLLADDKRENLDEILFRQIQGYFRKKVLNSIIQVLRPQFKIFTNFYLSSNFQVYLFSEMSPFNNRAYMMHISTDKRIRRGVLCFRKFRILTKYLTKNWTRKKNLIFQILYIKGFFRTVRAKLVILARDFRQKSAKEFLWKPEIV